MKLLAQNKFLIIGLVVLVAIAVWYGLSMNSGAPQLITTTGVGNGSPTQENADQQLVATLLTLRSVSLTGSIFQDPAFTSLRDFGTTIIAEPVGRMNPFAPFGAPVSEAATTSPSSPRGGR